MRVGIIFILLRILDIFIIDNLVAQNLKPINISSQNDRYFLAIPDSIIGKDILVVTRFIKSASGIERNLEKNYGGYGGDKTCETIIRFEKGLNQKILLKKISYSIRYLDSGIGELSHAVRNSNMQPIYSIFECKIVSGIPTIDVTDLLTLDNDVLYFDQISRNGLRLGVFQKDKSYINYIKLLTENTTINSVKTYSVPGLGYASMELSTCLMLLPEKPMQPRFADSRIGYFTTEIVDYEKDPHQVRRLSMITRWRLEIKPEDIGRYSRGEKVEPLNPITFYIDPATPKKWIPFLIKGVEDWIPAFEQAGFKNAISAKIVEATSDSTPLNWSLGDLRFSTIMYQASETKNAMPSMVVDPRSGEIIQCNIKWYHNIIKQLHDLYFLEASPSDPRARKMKFDDDLMGELVRYICSHEVGHALGLPHNWIASFAVPVDSLRNKKWVEINGICPSIMDYARFNYVAQVEDSLNSRKGLINTVGDYDRWAIEWGYKIISPTAGDENSILNSLIINKMKNKRFWYGYTATGRGLEVKDPRARYEDLGDDPMKAGYYGIENLKYLKSNLLKWTSNPGKDYQDLKEMYGLTVTQYYMYVQNVVANLTQHYETLKTSDQVGPVYEAVPLNIKKRALDFLKKQLFFTPTWLLDTAILSRIGKGDNMEVGNFQSNVLSLLMKESTLNNLIYDEESGKKEAYPIFEYMRDLRMCIWNDLLHNDFFKRSLQKTYIANLEKLLEVRSLDPASSCIPDIARLEMNYVQKYIRASLLGLKDEKNILHLKGVLRRIDDKLVGHDMQNGLAHPN